MALKVYGRLSSANVQKVLFLASHLKVPFERIDAGGAFGGTTTAEFLKMNPNSRVPVIDDGGFFLFESHAILRYLSATQANGSAIYPKDPKQRATIEAWMDWLNSHFGPPITTLFLSYVRTPTELRDPAATERARLEAEPFAKVLNDQIGGKKYVVGDELTVADVALSPFVHRWLKMPIERPALPSLERWYELIQTHEGAQKYVILPLE